MDASSKEVKEAIERDLVPDFESMNDAVVVLSSETKEEGVY